MAGETLLKPTLNGDIHEVTPEEVKQHMHLLTLVDVRTSNEFDGELSHIPGAKLITLGPDLDSFLQTHDKEDEIVFICRSGARSGRVTLQSRAFGFTKTVNLQGGMVLWNTRNFPTAATSGEES